MKDYSKAKIYKIVCNISGLVYFGSTCEPTLARRLAKHVGNYKVWRKDNSKTSYITSYKVIEGGNYDIILVEEVKCETQDQLHARERFYIESMECVNIVIPTRTMAEYCKKYRVEHDDELKQKKHNFYEKNKNTILIKQKEYRQQHKNEISIKEKEYRENHKEELCLKQKQYRDKNKEELKAKKGAICSCICGKTYTHSMKARHERTQYHQNYLNSETEINDDNLPCSLDGLELERN